MRRFRYVRGVHTEKRLLQTLQEERVSIPSEGAMKVQTDVKAGGLLGCGGLLSIDIDIDINLSLGGCQRCGSKGHSKC